MTASITNLTAHRAITQAERLLASGINLAPVGGPATVPLIPVPAELLAQLLTLARGATEIAETIDALAVAPDAVSLFLEQQGGARFEIVVPAFVTDRYRYTNVPQRLTVATRDGVRRLGAWMTELGNAPERVWADMGGGHLHVVNRIDITTGPGEKLTAVIELEERV